MTILYGPVMHTCAPCSCLTLYWPAQHSQGFFLLRYRSIAAAPVNLIRVYLDREDHYWVTDEALDCTHCMREVYHLLVQRDDQRALSVDKHTCLQDPLLSESSLIQMLSWSLWAEKGINLLSPFYTRWNDRYKDRATDKMINETTDR